MLSRTGKGISELTVRQLCNVVYARHVNEIIEYRRLAETNGGKFQDTLDEAVEQFDYTIGQRKDPAELALAMHRAFLESQGKEWDAAPVGPDVNYLSKYNESIPGTFMGDVNDPARKG